MSAGARNLGTAVDGRPQNREQKADDDDGTGLGDAQLTGRAPGRGAAARPAWPRVRLPAATAARPPARPRPDPGRDRLLAAARDQLAEYFAGQRQVFDLPVDWSGYVRGAAPGAGRALDSVGYRRDGDLRGAGAARGGRAGRHLAARPRHRRDHGLQPVPVIVPCHRVVAGNGLGGYSGGTGIEIKRWLLIFEGALPATLDWTPAGDLTRPDGLAAQPPVRWCRSPGTSAVPAVCSTQKPAQRQRRGLRGFRAEHRAGLLQDQREVLPVPADHHRRWPLPTILADPAGACWPRRPAPRSARGRPAPPPRPGPRRAGRWPAALGHRADHPAGREAAPAAGPAPPAARPPGPAAAAGRRRARRPASPSCARRRMPHQDERDRVGRPGGEVVEHAWSRG